MIEQTAVEDRIAQLERERAALIEQAQLQLARLDGAIAALRQLTEEATEPQEEPQAE